MSGRNNTPKNRGPAGHPSRLEQYTDREDNDKPMPNRRPEPNC